MRRTIARVTVFFLSLSLGVAVSSVPGQRHESTRAVQDSQSAEQVVSETEPAAPLQETSSAQSAVKFETVKIVTSNAYTNTQSIALRDRPQANAAVSAVLNLPGIESVEILGATRDYLHVRFLAANGPPEDKNRESNREGWVAWGEVMPSVSAIVLDAESGKIVSRVPLNSLDSSAISATFSPDNSRVVFYSDGFANEVETENYTLKRSLAAKFDDTSLTATFFYGSTDNTLYAALHPLSYSSQPSQSMLNVVRVSRAYESTPAPEISELSSGFVIAPDGRTAFIMHPVNAEADEMVVDVLDLQGMRVSNTLTLRGENLPNAASSFVTSADGRELYASLFPSREVISVIDTSTGQLLREIPVGPLKERAQYLSQHDLVGNSLFFRVWEGEGEEEVSHSVWLDAGKTSKAQRGIDYAVEADGVRLAVNDSGTRLFKLDSDNRIREKYWIDRPDVRLGQGNAQSLGVHKFIASPDGKRIILILGTIHGC